MQSASNNFSEAVSGSSVTWAPPRVFADWDRTGYGPDGSLDDLSAQVGDSFTVSHHLDDGMPEEVSMVSGVGSPTLEAPLVAGRTDYGQTNRRASAYFSPYNSTSPVSGFDRDVAPVKLDWGVVTKAGLEHVRLFTGQMMNIPVKGQGAEIQAMSATRSRLRKLIQPPAIDGRRLGLNATWCVSYALAQTGLYVSPPPRPGCRYWAPMHGSAMPVIPATRGPEQVEYPRLAQLDQGQDPLDSTITVRPDFVPGPFVLGINSQVRTVRKRRLTIDNMEFAPGPNLLSKAGNKGRIEFWVRGDPADLSTAPGGPGSVPKLAGIMIRNSNGTYVECRIGNDRKGSLRIYDGSAAWEVQTTATLPTDGNWYFVGGAWDLSSANFTMAIRQFDGTTSYYAAGPTSANLPASDDPDPFSQYPAWESYLPVAEVQVTAGLAAGGNGAITWIADPGYSWTNSVVMRPSFLELEALAEIEPREAWEFIGSFAQAELAAMRTDEKDLFEYLTMAYWAEPEQQMVADTLSTSLNMADIDVEADPSKIRNSIRISYTQTQVDDVRDELYSATSQVPIPPGTTTITIAFNRPAIFVDPSDITLLDDDYLSANGVPESVTYATLSDSQSGSGAYATQNGVIGRLTAWHPGGCTLTFTNSTGITYYFVNASNVPSLSIKGHGVDTATAAVVAQEPNSIAKRGERGLAISLPAIQRRSDALAIAGELAVRLAKARPVIGEVELFPDPRRQPGDLVILTDEVNTMASGLWRAQSITHERSGDSYTQTATVRQAMPVGRWDVDSWDDCIWGP